MNARKQGIIEYHMKKLDQAANGIIGVAMVMEAMLIEEGSADSKFPYKTTDFVGGCLFSAMLTLAWSVTDEKEIIGKMLEEEN